MPRPRSTPTSNNRVNWQERDRQILAQVQAAVEQLLVIALSPIRIPANIRNFSPRSSRKASSSRSMLITFSFGDRRKTFDGGGTPRPSMYTK